MSLRREIDVNVGIHGIYLIQIGKYRGLIKSIGLIGASKLRGRTRFKQN